MNLFSRYVESIYKGKEIPGGLSKGRLNHRVYEIKRIKEGLEFCIVRHPYAWRRPEAMEEVKQRWSFNIEEKKLDLLSK